MHKKVDNTDLDTTLTTSPLFVMMNRWSHSRTEEQDDAIWTREPVERGWPVSQYTRFARKRDGMAALLVDYCNGVSALFTEKGLVVFHATHEDLLASWLTDADTSGFGTPPNPGAMPPAQQSFGTPPNPG